MYGDKIKDILCDIENKDIEIAGGSVVGMVLSITNSLVMYISNLTIGKKNYEDMWDRNKEILDRALLLRERSLIVIDKDKEILEKILYGYKVRKSNPSLYESICIDSVNFCMDVLDIAYNTYLLSKEICDVGNKNLKSDFKIVKYYSYASVKASIVNIDINLDGISDIEFKNSVIDKYNDILSLIDGE